MDLTGKTVVIGITGGIAAYKMCEVVSALKKAGADIRVVMTKNATRFIAPLTFETLSNNRVVSDMFDRDYEWEVEHISLAKKADIFVVAPCTANFAGKLAGGIGDDFLSTTALAMTCPVLLAPAMNTNMYRSAAYQHNEKILSARGVRFVTPGSGRLACGDVGEGRLAEPAQIVAAIGELLCPKCDYEGKTVLVTAGATSEPIDPVRFISNRSSGKMGFAIARAAYRRGARVILIAGRTDSFQVPPEITLIKVSTTREMYDAVLGRLGEADYVVKAAAPADYRVKQPAGHKLKSETLTLQLEKNPDIAAAVGKAKTRQKLVIFSAETERLIENATEKLKKKNADLVVANDVTQEGAGFDVDTNIAALIDKKGCEQLPLMPKAELAERILDRMLDLK